MREVITTFWHQFFMSLSTGATEKVSSVRHDYQHQEWEAIGKILVYGYCEIKYFPVTHSAVFMGSCLFEERDISGIFLEAFSLYISKDEAETFKQCKEGKLEAKKLSWLWRLESNGGVRRVLEPSATFSIFSPVVNGKFVEKDSRKEKKRALLFR